MKQTEAKTFRTYVNSRQQYEKHPDAFTGGAYMLSMQLLLDELAEEEMKQRHESQSKWVIPKHTGQKFSEPRFSNKIKAAEALKIMKDIERIYGYITLSDYYESCCNTNEEHFIDDNFGWTDLSDAVIRLSKDNDGSYTISMPPIRNIEKEIKEITKNGK